MNSIAIRTRGLVKRYEDLVAVNGLDLEVHAGECFGLLGPNGAGKTTTVEILEGLLPWDSGEVEVLGRSWAKDGTALRQELGIQLQETQLAEKLTVMETIRLFRSFYKKGLEPQAVLERVSLQEKANVWVRKLSGGQQQRLSLACALVCDPQILFLDEPTTGLDPQSRRQIWELVASLRERNRTVLLTTHYMEEAERLCDRVAIVDRGQIIDQGTPRELIASLGAEHVVEFRCEPALPSSRLADLEGVQGVAEENGSVRLRVGQVHKALPALMDEVRRESANLTFLTTHSATLEDVFVAKTGRQLRDE